MNLKKRSKVVVAISVLVLFGIACGRKQDAGGPPYKAEVLTLVPRSEGKEINDPTQYQLQTVTFKYLKNIDTLASEYFEFRSGGVLTQSRNSVALSEIDVSEVALHYRVKEGVVIPGDSYGLYAMSLAYQMDYVLSEIEAISGIHPNEILAKHGRFKIYFNTDLSVGRSSQKNTSGNAYWIPGNYSFVTLKTSKEETIPLAANLKVIAHEFGHLFFDYLTTRFDQHHNFREESERKEIKGFNEGFADVTSYTLTGVAHILGESFDTEKQRLLDTVKLRDFSQINFKERDMDSCKRVMNFYCYGVLFANAYLNTMHQLGMDVTQRESRIEGYKKIVDALKNAGDDIKGHGLGSDHTFRDFLNTLINHIDDPAFRGQFDHQMRNNFNKTL